MRERVRPEQDGRRSNSGEAIGVMWLEAWPEDGQVRFKWGNDAGPHPPVYSVAPQTLRQAAEEVSQRLSGLTEWAKTRDPDQLCARLTPVAEAGARLEWILFDPRQVGGVPVDLTNLKQWIADERSAGDTVLTINADPDLHVPWGLVFEGDWSAIKPGAKECANFKGFWALRYTAFRRVQRLEFVVHESNASSRVLPIAFVAKPG